MACRFNCDIDWFVRMDWHVYSGGGKREGGGYRGGSHGGSCGGYRCESCSGYGYGGDGYVNRYSGGRGGYSRVGGGGWYNGSGRGESGRHWSGDRSGERKEE